jgi:hypothetical protein
MANSSYVQDCFGGKVEVLRQVSLTDEECVDSLTRVLFRLATTAFFGIPTLAEWLLCAVQLISETVYAKKIKPNVLILSACHINDNLCHTASECSLFG